MKKEKILSKLSKPGKPICVQCTRPLKTDPWSGSYVCLHENCPNAFLLTIGVPEKNKKKWEK